MRAILSVLLASTLAVSTAHAQSTPTTPTEEIDPDTEARRLFQEGQTAYDGARFAEALDLFRAAYAMSPRPVMNYNIGLAAQRLGRYDESIEAWEAYLTDLPQAPNRTEVEGRLQVVRDARAARERPVQDGPLSEPAPTRGDDLLLNPIFWAVIGVVVVGAAAGIAGAVLYDPGIQAPLPGDGGFVVMALD